MKKELIICCSRWSRRFLRVRCKEHKAIKCLHDLDCSGKANLGNLYDTDEVSIYKEMVVDCRL